MGKNVFFYRLMATLLLFVSCTSQDLTDLPATSQVNAADSRVDRAVLGARFGMPQNIMLPTEATARVGVSTTYVQLESAADAAGIKTGDMIYEYDGQRFAPEQIAEAPEILRIYIRDKKKIGDVLKLKIYREQTHALGKFNDESRAALQNPTRAILDWIGEQKISDNLTISIAKSSHLFEVAPVLKRRKFILPAAPPANRDLPAPARSSDANFRTYPDRVDFLTANFSLTHDYDDLLKRLSDQEWWDDGLRLDRVRYARREPARFPELADGIFTQIKNSVTASDLIKVAAENLDIRNLDNTLPKINVPSKNPFDRQLEFILDILGEANLLNEAALSEINLQDQRFMREQIAALSDRHLQSGWSSEENPDAYHDFEKFIQLAKKADLKKYFQSLLILTKFTDDNWIKDFTQTIEKSSLRNSKKIETAGVRGEILFQHDTPQGKIIIGGKNKNVYEGEFAFIMDLGGDDFYRDSGAAVNSPEIPVSVILDLDGNDQYSATDDFHIGSAALGTSMLIDLAGDDSYRNRRLGIGSAVLGTALLIDGKGNDNYISDEMSQGFSHFGTGILWDVDGHDTYNARFASQAVGGAGGVGMLVDSDGDDSYFASGKFQSSYGHSGIFEGYSQGYGVGLREEASGGMGILTDLKGNDRFEAGNFSQGGGYFYGMGLLLNAGSETDRYIASHYGQGFAAHAAAGILIDEGGNDHYEGSVLALQGVAWDLSVAALIDKSGNDFYDAEHLDFSQGAAAHNGFALFHDYSGQDTYRQHAEARAQSEPNDYHGGTSLALFIDDGGEDDYDHNTEFLNGTLQHRGRHGIYVDVADE